MTSGELYEAAKAKGVEIDHHKSDLYIPVNDTTRALVKEYDCTGNVTTFVSNVDGKFWYNIPFAYQPFWDKVARRVAAVEEARKINEARANARSHAAGAQGD